MNRWGNVGLVATLMVVLGGDAGVARSGKLEGLIAGTVAANTAAADAQARVDGLSDERSELLSEYRALSEHVESLRIYEAQLGEQLAAQTAEIASLRRQIDSATHVGRELVPMMTRMLAALRQFIELDVPFLLEERRQRVATLEEVMGRADVTTSEKFRRLLEAFQVENDYGRTIEAYQGTMGEGAAQRTVDFLRVGRVTLMYQSLDEKEVAVWDQGARQWTALDSEYRGAIKKGLRIARRQTAPDLIRVPVPAPGGGA